jgi:predicted DNA-binding WGR domain protein
MIQLLVLDRIDKARNVARFYVLAIEPTLFEEVSLVREWGRIGSKGSRRIDLQPGQIAARTALRAWLRQKMKRGYRLRAISNERGQSRANQSAQTCSSLSTRGMEANRDDKGQLGVGESSRRGRKGLGASNEFQRSVIERRRPGRGEKPQPSHVAGSLDAELDL